MRIRNSIFLNNCYKKFLEDVKINSNESQELGLCLKREMKVNFLLLLIMDDDHDDDDGDDGGDDDDKDEDDNNE